MWVKGCAFAFSCSGAGLLTVDLFVFFQIALESYSDTVIRNESWRWLSLLLFFFFLGVNISLIIPTRGEPG